MRTHELFELRNPGEIKQFARLHDDPKIVTRVQSQAARKNPAWKKTLTGLMAKNGFALLGAGVNGTVFENPRYPFVLKVYRTDQGFDEWLHFVRTHVGNPYLPQLRGKTVRLNSIFSAVRIEPLKPCVIEEGNALVDEINELTGSYPNIVAARETKPDLADVALFMRDWEPVSDLTAHNIMQRPNGQLVIIDPIYIEPGQSLDW